MKIDQYQQAASVWLTYKAGLKNYILKKVKDPAISEDLTHEVLMRVYQTCCSNREVRNVKSWLFQIAHNLVYDFFEQQKNISLEHDMAEPSDNLAYKQLSECLEPLLQLLPEKYATPLYLSDIKGIKQSEVAQRLQLSLSAVKSRIQRARILLKKEILKCCYIDLDENGSISAVTPKNK